MFQGLLDQFYELSMHDHDWCSPLKDEAVNTAMCACKIFLRTVCAMRRAINLLRFAFFGRRSIKHGSDRDNEFVLQAK